MTHPTLQQSHGPQYTRILSIGAARGDIVVPNDDLVGPINSSDEWIRQRTGIITRTRASHDVGAVDLATQIVEHRERRGLRLLGVRGPRIRIQLQLHQDVGPRVVVGDGQLLAGDAPEPGLLVQVHGRRESSVRAEEQPSAPQLGGADGLSVSIQIWNRVVCSSSRLYSACVTPVPALITWTSPAPVRPLFPIESWWVIAPVRT